MSATSRATTLDLSLEYNSILVTGDDHRQDFATLAVAQFDRAIAANALSSLEAVLRERVYRTYKLITETSDLIRSRMSHSPGGSTYNVISNLVGEKRKALRAMLPGMITGLRSVLGSTEDA